MQGAVGVSQVRPWVRFLARSIDLSIFGIFVGLLLYPISPLCSVSLETRYWSEIAFSFTLLFLWVFAEAALLSTWGTTPGKRLLKIKVTMSAKKLSFKEAFRRSFMVWWRGLAAGLPFIRIGTAFLAYSVLKEFKITSWDNDGGYTVFHGKIGISRIIFAVLLFYCCYVGSVISLARLIEI
jgi:hypothetical protein